VVTGVDPELKTECLYVVSPINIGNTGAPWALIIRTPLSTVMAQAHSMIWTQVLIAIIGTLVLLAAVVYIARYISKSVAEISARLHKSGEQVASAIEQLSLAGQNLSESSSASAASLEETVAALEEMSSMVRMNSDNAKQASSLSSASSEAALNGEKEMTALLESMKEISTSSKKIEEIINVIDDIAFQTNLLALNAAVEAARAGEQGKGFAVVAEAVRALAQRSALAAKDINGLIKESVAQIEHGTQQADRSGEVLKNIVVSVKKVSDLNLEISTASEEQATGIGQISKAMNQLDASVQSNAASSEEIAGTATEINTQASVMKNATEEMNTFVYGDKTPKADPLAAEVIPFEKHKKAA
ncbi:MAG: methyl-accepting chemotaxis protein, partial [Bacillota bacterium]